MSAKILSDKVWHGRQRRMDGRCYDDNTHLRGVKIVNYKKLGGQSLVGGDAPPLSLPPLVGRTLGRIRNFVADGP